jgi:pimeloyl-ACP methyl ester carboxylesterase
MALDDRIACASPACYMTSFEKLLHTIGPQDAEQNIFGQVAFGMNHADYLIMRGPKPTLICAARKDFFDIEGARDSFEQSKRIYETLGHGDRVAMQEADGPHGWSQPLREAAVGWMVRWLRGEEREIKEPEIDVLTDAEMNVTPRGQVMLLEGAVNAFDINIEENKQLAAERAKFWKETPRDETLGRVQRTAAIATGADFRTERVAQLDDGTGQLPRYILHREAGVPLSIAVFPAESPTQQTRRVLYVSDRGWNAAAQSDGPIVKLAAQGNTVIAVDVSGAGETASSKGEWYNKRFGSEGRNATVAYLVGKTLLAMRAEDILAAAKFAANEIEPKGTDNVDLIAIGELGPAALHAAALHPDLFNKVRLERSLASFTSVVETPVVENQWVHMIHGALRVYDLPDLAASLGDKLEIVEPVDASGRVIENKK